MSSFARGNTTRGSPRIRASQRGSGMSRNASTSTVDNRSTSQRARANPSRAPSSRGHANSSIAHVQHQSFRKSGLSNVQNAKGNWQERYTALQESRKRERSDAIKRGLMADPDKPTTLAEAITLVGTCQDMCAEFERVERVVQKDVWKEEVDPGRIGANPLNREPDESRMVKKFRRAAAGIEEQLPSDLRPPSVLQMTCNYLFSEVIGAARDLASVHHFVWDRTRAIRNDFSIQQLSRSEDLAIAINCYEQIARFHILSLHQLALPEKPYDKYDWQQEREQLDRTLLSLIQYYDDSRGKIPLPNESEFRAYCVIFQLRNPDPDLEEKVQTWPTNVANHPRVRAALTLYAAACNTSDTYGPLKPTASHAIAQQDWHHVWRLIESNQLSYLMACVAEIHFNMVRENILNALLKSGGIKNMVQWSMEELRMIMAFDTEESLIEFCARYDLAFIAREGRLYLDFSQLKNRSLPNAKADAAKQSKTQLVEQKRGGRTIPAIINGLSFKQASEQNMVVEEEADEMEDVSDQEIQDQSSDDGLFVSEQSSKPPASIFTPAPEQATANFKSPFTTTDFGQPSAPKVDFGKPPPNTAPMSTFGKPSSATTETPSTFGKPSSAASAASSTFGQPSATGVTSVQSSSSPSIFPTKNTQPKPNGAPVFDFLAGLKQAKASDKSTSSTSLQQTAPPATATQSGETSIPPVSTSDATQPATSSDFSFMTAKTEQLAPLPQATDTSKEVPDTPFSFLKQPNSIPTTTTAVNDNTMRTFPPSSSDLFQKPAMAFPTNSNSSTLFQNASIPEPDSFTKPTNSFSAPSVTQSSSPGEFKPSTVSDLFSKSPFASTATAAQASDISSHIAQSTNPSIKPDQSTTPPVLQQPVQPAETAPPLPDLDSIVTRLAQELTCEPKTGFLKQYVEFFISQIITEVQETVYEERLNEEAKHFREQVLTLRYGRRWRLIYRHARLTKQARERRTRAFKRLNDHKSQTSAASSTVGDGSVIGGSQHYAQTTTSAPTSKRDLVDQLFQQTNGVSKWAKIAADQEKAREARRQSISSQHRDEAQRRASRVDSSGRIVKPSTSNTVRSSAGRSSLKASPPVKSTTKSNYFRLKALGLDKIDASLATSRKRGYSELSSEVSESSRASSVAQARLQIQSSQTHDDQPPESPRSKMLKMYDEEDALFARLRAARENLQEGMSFYQTEVAKSTSPQSVPQSKTTTTYDSPSMQRARQEARWRLGGADVPAYRLRESKFVPSWSGSTSHVALSHVASPSPADALAAASSNLFQSDLRSTQVPSPAFSGAVDVNYGNDASQQSYSTHTMHADQSQATAQNTAQLGDDYTLTSTLAAKSFDTIPEQSNISLAESTTLSPSQPRDFTIKPSQIPESLAASFGPPQSNDTQSFSEDLQPFAKRALDSFGSLPRQDPVNEVIHPFAHDSGAAYVPNGNHSITSLNGVTNKASVYSHHDQNPFAALQDEYDVSRDQTDEAYNNKLDGIDPQHYDDTQLYYNEHNETGYSEVGRDDSDLDADEAESDGDEDEQDSTSEIDYHHRRYPGSDDEAAESEDCDSEASEESEINDAYRRSAPPVNEALQVVGNTEEDAIELSD